MFILKLLICNEKLFHAPPFQFPNLLSVVISYKLDKLSFLISAFSVSTSSSSSNAINLDKKINSVLMCTSEKKYLYPNLL